MSISTFAVPVDIPWTRIAFSADMMDKVACDREMPLRWRSSVAVFRYVPPKEQQPLEGIQVSYLKVSCSITGFQPDGKEVKIRERLAASGWTSKNVATNIADSVSAYYPCYGAMLEVVVAPHDANGRFQDYPYFADFDPKKRELYETVTDTGETMSRSLEDTNVRLGQSTLQSHEVRDNTNWTGAISGALGAGATGGASAAAGGTGIAASGGVASGSETTDLSQQRYENVRTSDQARENRETLSHTTQLSQMYHQLDSYHLGTNRASFYLLPRPHVVQSPSTFVNGPREIEGIQEFMLVVVCPEAQADYCVEAYLETAHLVRQPVTDPGSEAQTLVLPKIDAPVEDRDGGIFDGDDDSYDNPQTGSVTYSAPVGKKIDEDKGLGGYDIVKDQRVGNAGYTVEHDSSHVTIKGWANGRFVDNRTGNDLNSASLEVEATIYLQDKDPKVIGFTDGLLLTGRAVCSCRSDLRLTDPFITHEVSLAGLREATTTSRDRGVMRVQDANHMQATIRREMLRSVGSANRYPRGKVGFLDAQFLATGMGSMIRNADANARLADFEGVDDAVKRQILDRSPHITRSRLLQMGLMDQVATFGLSVDEAVSLRRALVDLPEPAEGGPRPRPTAQIPNVLGLPLEEARVALARARFAYGGAETVESAQPSGVVVGQSPEPGAEAQVGDAVSLQLASGLSVRLPDVVGLGIAEAACRLRDAGLQSDPDVTGSGRYVASLDPPERTWITPRANVSIRLSARPSRGG